MKVTEENKEELLENYIRDIYMSTQFANPAWNHHIKPTIKTIRQTNWWWDNDRGSCSADMG